MVYNEIFYSCCRLILSSAIDFEAVPVEDISNFVKGLIIGLGNGQSSCSAQGVIFDSQILQMIQDF